VDRRNDDQADGGQDGCIVEPFTPGGHGSVKGDRSHPYGQHDRSLDRPTGAEEGDGRSQKGQGSERVDRLARPAGSDPLTVGGGAGKVDGHDNADDSEHDARLSGDLATLIQRDVLDYV
jgi:hypothetical protein